MLEKRKEAVKFIKDRINYLNGHIQNYTKKDCITSVCQTLIEEKNYLEETLNLIQKQQEEIEKRDKKIDEYQNRVEEKQLTINRLKTLAGLALKGRPLEISQKALAELDNTIEIEYTQNISNNSYIFRAK